ncbi:MAG TPA: HPr kinase/phosphatase C-terminal domain-containing protein [Novosphingobium sp.]|nr:HPr kinase/phosphatase C-terminal domain-containing protein [Novosphingobium sp.]
MAHTATCIAIGGRGLLIEGESGAGKSNLALALIDRGARLVGDDGVMLDTAGDRLFASPHPNTRGLLEVRNVGLVPLDPVERVPVCLLVMLCTRAPRFIEGPEQVQRAGARLPLVRLWPDSPVLALRAEMALGLHGLPLPATG